MLQWPKHTLVILSTASTRIVQIGVIMILASDKAEIIDTEETIVGVGKHRARRRSRILLSCLRGYAVKHRMVTGMAVVAKFVKPLHALLLASSFSYQILARILCKIRYTRSVGRFA